MNKVIMIGRLTKAPELRYTQGGVPYCGFTLAVDRNQKDSNGERQADFFPCRAWRGTAEACAAYLAKGAQVAIFGELQNRSYQVQDGSKRQITEVIVDQVQFLSGKRSGEEQTELPLTDGDLPF